MQNAVDLPLPGERVVAAGHVRDQKDVNNNAFKTIEFTKPHAKLNLRGYASDLADERHCLPGSDQLSRPNDLVC